MAFNASIMKNPFYLESDYSKKAEHYNNMVIVTPEHLKNSRNLAFTLCLGVWYLSYKGITKSNIGGLGANNKVMFNFIASYCAAHLSYKFFNYVLTDAIKI